MDNNGCCYKLPKFISIIFLSEDSSLSLKKAFHYFVFYAKITLDKQMGL